MSVEKYEINQENINPPFSRCTKEWPTEIITCNDKAVKQCVNKSSNFLFTKELDIQQSKDRWRVSDLLFEVEGIQYLITYDDDVIGDGIVTLNKGISIYKDKFVTVYQVKYLLLHASCTYTYFNNLDDAEKLFNDICTKDMDRWS